MRLYVMRHGQAEPIAPADEQRALTSRGRGEVASIGKHYLHGVQFDYVYVSPYLRAQQSWQVLQELGVQTLGQATVNWVTPDSSTTRAIDQLTTATSDMENVLLVCHQPFVGKVTTQLCDGHNYGLHIATAGLVIMEMDVVAKQCATLISVFAP